MITVIDMHISENSLLKIIIVSINCNCHLKNQTFFVYFEAFKCKHISLLFYKTRV